MTDLRVTTIVIGVTDQDAALAWFTGKLGFEKREDMVYGDMRWLTVGSPGDPVSFSLANWFPDNIGTNAPIELRTANCEASYQTLLANGVEFLEPASVRPYGTVAAFKDPCGNIYLLKENAGG